jgi:uncharacterized caspase-like protein
MFRRIRQCNSVDLLRQLAGVLLLIHFLTAPAQAANKVALIIGISTYQNGPALPNASRDSQLIADAFRRVGFDTVILNDVTRQGILLGLAQLRIRAQSADQVVIYYAGHGLQKMGETYLLASDYLFETEVPAQGFLPIGTLIKAISDKPRQKIIIFDGCRDNPAYKQGVAKSAQVPTAGHAGVFVLFSAQPGASAFDGHDNHSPFALSLSQALDVRGAEIEQIARRVRLDVIRATNGLQIPWSQSSLLRHAILNDGSDPFN